MVADFNLGHDIHAATAAKVFHVPMDQVTNNVLPSRHWNQSRSILQALSLRPMF